MTEASGFSAGPDLLQDPVTAETQHYLDLYRAQPPEQFAVIKVSGATLADEAEEAALIDAVAQMARAGLYPTIVHGGKPQINAALQDAGIVEKWSTDGLRVTDEAAIGVIEETLTGINGALVRRLGAMGIEAAGLERGVIGATIKDYERCGLVGDVSVGKVDVSVVAAACQRGAVPVVSCLGTGPDGQPLNVNGDDASRILGEVLGPLKYVAITPTAGVLDGKGDLIKVLTLQPGLIEELEESGVLQGGMLKKVKEAKALLSERPHMDVAFTQACFLLEELFSHRGHGTLVTHTEQVCRYVGFNGVDESSIHTLLEQSFGTEVDWAEVREGVEAVIITNQTYHGVAIMKRIGGHPYLDKLAVAPEARERGVATTLLNRLSAAYPDGFLWRSRSDNPFLGKYQGFAHYSETRLSSAAEEWEVFWHSRDGKVPPDFSAVADQAVEIPAVTT